MRLHAEEILITFLRLMHFRIALAVLVLGRTGCVDDGCVDNGALAQRQALVSQVIIDGFRNARRQLMLLQQVPEIHDRRVFGDRSAERQTSNWRIEVISYSASSMAGSLNANQFYSR